MKGGFPGIPSKPRFYFTILRESKIHIFLGELAPRPLYLLPDYSTLINLYNIIIYKYNYIYYIIIIIYLYETFKLIVIIQYLQSKLCIYIIPMSKLIFAADLIFSLFHY